MINRRSISSNLRKIASKLEDSTFDDVKYDDYVSLTAYRISQIVEHLKVELSCVQTAKDWMTHHASNETAKIQELNDIHTRLSTAISALQPLDESNPYSVNPSSPLYVNWSNLEDISKDLKSKGFFYEENADYHNF